MQGCYVTGLYLEGARWDPANRRLARSTPKVLVEPLPVLSVVPIEVHRLKLQVSFVRSCSSPSLGTIILCVSACSFVGIQVVCSVYTDANRGAYVSHRPCPII